MSKLTMPFALGPAINPGKLIGVKPMSVIFPRPPTDWLRAGKILKRMEMRHMARIEAILQKDRWSIRQGLKDVHSNSQAIGFGKSISLGIYT
jgi:hypothetical protein